MHFRRQGRPRFEENHPRLYCRPKKEPGQPDDVGNARRRGLWSGKSHTADRSGAPRAWSQNGPVVVRCGAHLLCCGLKTEPAPLCSTLGQKTSVMCVRVSPLRLVPPKKTNPIRAMRITSQIKRSSHHNNVGSPVSLPIRLSSFFRCSSRADVSHPITTPQYSGK